MGILVKGLKSIFLILFLITGLVNPQQKNIHQQKNQLVKKELPSKTTIIKQAKSTPKEITTIIDTLDYFCFDMLGGLKFQGQDVLLQWFEAPADMIIREIGINCWADSGAPVLVGLRKANISADSIFELRNKQVGYYIVQENGNYSFSPFNDNQSDTINWVGKNIAEEPFGERLPFGCDVCYIPLEVKKENTNEFQWMKTNLLGIEPEVKAGEIIAVTIKNNSAIADSVIISSRFGCSLKYFGWKYYANGRYTANGITDSAGIGWRSRNFATALDVALIVELTGCVPAKISLNKLKTTVYTDPREIEAQIDFKCGIDSIASVVLQYNLNNSNEWLEVPMVLDSAKIWRGILPGQAPGTEVKYKVCLTDRQGRKDYSETFSYRIFEPTSGINTLLVFNGNDYSPDENLYPQDYYFGVSDFTNYSVREFPHDVWSNGQLSDEILYHYNNIIEITTPEPDTYNDSVIVKWLNSSGDHNYFLVGQEYLGIRNRYSDRDFTAGDFEYDFMGITHSFNDVSYAESGGQALPSRLYPVQGSLLCSDLFDLYNLQTPGDSLQYHPYYELGTSYTNWIDGYKVDTNSVEVDMYVETRGIGGQVHVELLPCASHLTLPAGNKIAFFSFDPLALTTNVGKPNYYWYGFSKESPQNKVLDWFGITTMVDDEPVFYPQTFKLYQNYPNPFNPVTKIKYSLQVETLRATSLQNVTLKIYDVLGREVAILVNKEQPPGVYEVEWDAGSISSGIYFYELRTGNFVSIKKMIILR